MREDYLLKEIELSELLPLMESKLKDGYRLVQIHSVRTAGGYELFYSVALDYTFENYKIIIDENAEVPSISNIFPSAMLYENEVKELFGVKINCISLDYNNRFYRIKTETPFK